MSRLTKVLSEALSSPVLSKVWTLFICTVAKAGGFDAAPPIAAMMASLEVSDSSSLWDFGVSQSGAKETDLLEGTMDVGLVVGSSASIRGWSHSVTRCSCSSVALLVECSFKAGQFGGTVVVEGR